LDLIDEYLIDVVDKDLFNDHWQLLELSLINLDDAGIVLFPFM